MLSPLFSTYRGGENRVTSSTMAVFERIDLSLVRELLQTATEMGEELPGVTFENQVVDPSKRSVPDARISGRFAWWFETKIQRDSYSKEFNQRQLIRHMEALEQDADAFLFVLTPDLELPAGLRNPTGGPEAVRDRIVWLSFSKLQAAIEEKLNDKSELLGERTRFLLSELVDFYDSEGLLSDDDTVVVAARRAWKEYKKYGAYVCQANRSFRDSAQYMGFYYQGHIMDRVARIRRQTESIVFSHPAADAEEANGDVETALLIRNMLADGVREEGDAHKIMFLTPFDGPSTEVLPRSIKNDNRAQSGRAWAWTLGQRYTKLDKLMQGPSFTSELDKL